MLRIETDIGIVLINSEAEDEIELSDEVYCLLAKLLQEANQVSN